MTVGELIEALQNRDPDTPVVCWKPGEYYTLDKPHTAIRQKDGGPIAVICLTRADKPETGAQ